MCSDARAAGDAQTPIPNVDALIRDHYDFSALDDESLDKHAKPRPAGKGPGWGRGGAPGGGGCSGGAMAEARGADQSGVEAILTPDQRRPSDAQPPDLSEIWGDRAPQGNGGSGGGRGGGDLHIC